jgi:TM2 domain-containing membrane protein YozV
MTTPHKNKTHAMFLASAFGGLGVHRFYLHGRKDLWGWAHFLTLPAAILISLIAYKQQLFFSYDWQRNDDDFSFAGDR